MAFRESGDTAIREPGDRAGRGPDRRDVLRAALLAATGGVLTAAGIAIGADAAEPRRQQTAAPTPPPFGLTGARPSAAPAEMTTVAPPLRPVAARPAWMHTWAAPISRLDADVAHRVGTRFPKRAVMLTIDDGPHPVWTPRYLRLLARHHVTATFNVIGEQVHDGAKLLRAAVGEGHHIGNHTYHHPLNLPSLSTSRIRHELEDTTDAIVRACGFRPRQFRAPGGVWGPDVFVEVARQQMMPLGWDIDPRDWSLPGVAEISQAMLAARPHDIILCHDGGGDRSQTYRALETVIPALLARGWQFVTLPAPL